LIVEHRTLVGNVGLVGPVELLAFAMTLIASGLPALAVECAADRGRDDPALRAGRDALAGPMSERLHESLLDHLLGEAQVPEATRKRGYRTTRAPAEDAFDVRRLEALHRCPS
jgi:hypothetical protein